MPARFCLVRSSPTKLSGLLLVGMIGCGGASSQHAAQAPSPGGGGAPAAAPPTAEPPADEAGGVAQPGADAVESGPRGADLSPPPPSQPSKKLGAGVGTFRRAEPTTLSEALEDLEEDEMRLGQLVRPGAVALAEQGTCGRVCDALASMRRSVEAVCELAGQDDDRCDDARGKLDRSSRRVADAGCACP